MSGTGGSLNKFSECFVFFSYIGLSAKIEYDRYGREQVEIREVKAELNQEIE